MKVLSAGGGSGGHVTPVLAVINELSKLDPHLEAAFVCDKAFESQARGLMAHANVKVTVQVIAAGKLRRYHGVPLWKQALDIPTVFKNVRDVAYIAIGFVQSLILLQRFKPDVVFAKGGYVCLPLGYAAKLLGIPLVIHDSDTRPGLTNKLLARHAVAIATGSPLENYTYPKAISVYTGVPIDAAFHPFNQKAQRQAKHEIGIVDLDKPVIVVTGGGLGARSINTGMLAIAEQLISDGFAVYHVTGKRHYVSVKAAAPEHPDYHVIEFVYKDMATVLGAADVVISRASATFLQELAALAKPAIVVPAAHLGDQMKNAEVYKAAEAAVVLDDNAVAEGTKLYETIVTLQQKPDMAHAMAERFHSFTRKDAALDVADMIVTAGTAKRRGAK
jgi:UDP-N-acetylglucosamine--N-acetylmuramyl-(pentapeptide) pyrophosphoryl-undecaprenol N-acetylglucosamine transferase